MNKAFTSSFCISELSYFQKYSNLKLLVSCAFVVLSLVSFSSFGQVLGTTKGLSSTCSPDTLAYWSFEDCSSSSNNVTTGMLPTITKLNSCTGLAVSKLMRNHSGNSCQTRCDGGGTSVCMGSSTDLTFVDNSTRAIEFSVSYPAGSMGQLSSINFQTMAPKYIDFNCSGDKSELNNNPTLWGMRVLKNNVEIFRLIDQPLSLNSFTTNNIDWSSNPNFAINGVTTFSFEILGYLPSNVAGAGIREIWDLDEVKVYGYCGNCICPKPNCGTVTVIKNL